MPIRCVRMCSVMIMRMRDIIIVGSNMIVIKCARVNSTVFTSYSIRRRSRSRIRSIGSRMCSSRRRRCSCSSRRRRRRCCRRRM